MFPKFSKDQKVMRYLPDRLPKGRLPDREYFFNVINTLYPDYTKELIAHAGRNRYAAASNPTDLGLVKVSEEWWSKLNS